MSRNVVAPLVLLVLVNVLASLLAARRRLSRAGIDLGKVRVVSRQLHQKIGEYVPGNYSGFPEQLPELVPVLVRTAAELAVAQGLELDQATLETMVATSLVSHHFAKRSDVNAALKRLHAERASAA